MSERFQAGTPSCIKYGLLTVLHVLHAGEVLGCTAPVVAQAADAIVFVADGRFHLEAIMIANPDIPAYRCVGAPLLPVIVAYITLKLESFMTANPDIPTCGYVVVPLLLPCALVLLFSPSAHA